MVFPLKLLRSSYLKNKKANISRKKQKLLHYKMYQTDLKHPIT